MNTIQQVQDFLSGYKTYIVAIVIAVLNLSVAAGWITPDHLAQFNWFLSGLGLAALRSGVNKVS